MDWKVGYKVIHPFNPDWGVGNVIAVGPQGRHITVHFPATDETVTLSTHEAAFHRWTFPPGSRATVVEGPSAGQDVLLVARERGSSGHDTYRTDSGADIPEQHLEPLGRVDGPLQRLERLDIDLVDHYENRYAGIQLDLERQTLGIPGILGARVMLFPHQLHVAHEVARKQPVRALLADEVGLGKTIEACMIYSALRQAGRADRVLVVVPDALAVQWLGELYRKFHDVFVLMDADRVDDAEQDHPNLSPWQVYPRTVCSLDFLTSHRLLAVDAAQLEEGWDLLIVDEAHHLRYDTQGANEAYQVVAELASNTRNILFLTATPMELDRREYFGLLKLLRPGLFHDFDLFEIQLEEIAAASELAKELGRALGEPSPAGNGAPAAESGFHLPDDLPERVADAFTDDARLEVLAELAVGGNQDAAVRLLDALTRLHPLGDTVFSNTRARVGGFPDRRSEIRVFDQSEARRAIHERMHDWVVEQARSERLGPQSRRALQLFKLLRLSSGPLAGLLEELEQVRRGTPPGQKRRFLEEMVGLCEATITEDSARLDALLDEVRNTIAHGEKLLVFVGHVADLEHLKNRIEARVGVRVATFHERLPAADRDIQVAMFRAPDGYPVLLSTEAGGEGRNFQFCHRLVHYDLPASPNRVEQRIGRLDRIGQRHAVENIVIVSRDTVEHHLATLLQEHIGVFEQTIGGLDPVMETIGARVVALSLSPGGRSASAWSALADEARSLLHGARDAIARGLDHLLHRGAFDPAQAARIQAAIPGDIEERFEEFIIDFCELTGITVQDKDGRSTYFLGLDRYCIFDALPGVPLGSRFLGTFRRETALEREDFDFFASGHALVEGIFGFIRDTPYGTTTIRRYKGTGFRPSTGVQFNFRLIPEAQEDVDAGAFFPPRLVPIAVDLDGTLRPELVDLLTARFSKAYPVDVEEIRHGSIQPGWLDRAARAAREEAGRIWTDAVAEAQRRFDTFAEEERARLEAFFEHRLDTAEAVIAFSSNARHVAAARKELVSIQEEWKRRIEHLRRRRKRLSRGEPVVDSVSLYIIE